MGNTWRKSDTFRDKKYERELKKSRKRLKKLAKKTGTQPKTDGLCVLDFIDYDCEYGEIQCK